MRLIILTLAVLFLFAAPASAGVVQDSAEFSEQRWGRIAGFRPCGGEIIYKWENLPDSALGFALFYRRADREEFGLVCEVTLQERQRTRLYANPQLLCSVILHEVGHLTGRGHSSNPNSIMYSRIPVDERCRNI
jgi:hypothetical protein